jgi:RNA polymerase sigma factor (sigma-70 family)
MDAGQSEESLMDAYVAGDARAFSRLFASLGPSVHAFFRRAFADRTVVDDLVQTTFLKIHRGRAAYRSGSPLRPWVFTIAAHVRLDELRRRYRLPAHADEDAIDAAERAQAPTEGRPDTTESEVTEAVRRAIGQLPPSQQAVIHLHRYEQLSFAEIARALGSTEGAIKLRAFRAYEALRRELRPLLGAERT